MTSCPVSFGMAYHRKGVPSFVASPNERINSLFGWRGEEAGSHSPGDPAPAPEIGDQGSQRGVITSYGLPGFTEQAFDD